MARGTALCGRATVGGGRPTSAAAPARGASGRAGSITDSRDTTDISNPRINSSTISIAGAAAPGDTYYDPIRPKDRRSVRERRLQALPPALQRHDCGKQRERWQGEPVAARPRRRHQDGGDLVA